MLIPAETVKIVSLVPEFLFLFLCSILLLRIPMVLMIRKI